jgi:hypothetical protein
MEFGLAAIVLAALVAAVVLHPLVRGGGDEAPDAGLRQELEAAKEAKYREIRDAQLDLQMGKLSKEDHRAVDRELRGEAIGILKRIDELDGKAPEA